jgi:hypothetical protein
VGSARLTCGQPASHSPSNQVSPKREDLTAPHLPFTISLGRAVDRQAVRLPIVFRDPALRAKLNAIVHPPVLERIRAAERTAADSGRNDLTVVHDVPLLAEGGRADGYHLVIVMTCRPSFSSSDWPASAAWRRIRRGRAWRLRPAGSSGSRWPASSSTTQAHWRTSTVASPRSRPIISAAPLGRELDDDGLGLGEKLCRVQVGLAPDRLFPYALAATTWVGGQLGLAALVTVLRRFGSDALSAAARRFNHG